MKITTQAECEDCRGVVAGAPCVCRGIVVWEFADAPDSFKSLSTSGGDEDWVIFVPKAFGFSGLFWLPWIEHMDAGRDPQKHEIAAGTVYIGCH